MAHASQVRKYDPTASVVFRKTKEDFGGLSNMAPGFPLEVNGIRIRTSEALYQACRFPHMPDLQRRIINERSPMTAKMRGKPFRNESRPDWNAVRVKIMRWCLRVKLAQNWHQFGQVLLETGDRPIVERSQKDDFWGAKATQGNMLVGMNVLGRLLMELREQLKEDALESFRVVEPLTIPEFLLFDEPIKTVYASKGIGHDTKGQTYLTPPFPAPAPSEPLQLSFFHRRNATETKVPVRNIRKALVGPYPVYKDSGIEWLRKVPQHWEVRRLKYVLRERDSRSIDGSEQLLRVSQYTGVTKRKLVGNGQEPDTRAESLVGYKHVYPNDLVVNIMLAWNGSMGVSQFDGIASPAYCVYRFNQEATPWYFHYLLRSPLYKSRIKSVSTGIVESRLRLYTDDLYRLEAILPPASEQAAIVRFLDHADRRIRRYIRAKQKLITLLEEQKQAIIHQAVTGQIDVRTRPYPAYKPSGVEWLSDVPEHWGKSKKIKYLSFLKGRLGWQGLKASEYTNVGPYIVSSAHFSDHKINWEKCPHVTQERYERDANIQLSQGDILLMKDGAAMGKLAFVDNLPGLACLNSHLLLFRPLACDEEPTYFPQFMFYYMQTEYFQGYVQINGTGATFLGISQESVGNHKICLPPYSEQVAIVERLDETIAEIDMVIVGANREISLLREYRTRLIADVVTGKLDVREVAAKLPEVDLLADESDADDTPDTKAELDIDKFNSALEEAKA